MNFKNKQARTVVSAHMWLGSLWKHGYKQAAPYKLCHLEHHLTLGHFSRHHCSNIAHTSTILNNHRRKSIHRINNSNTFKLFTTLQHYKHTEAKNHYENDTTLLVLDFLRCVAGKDCEHHQTRMNFHLTWRAVSPAHNQLAMSICKCAKCRMLSLPIL